jgi:hypothetical protein
MLMRRAAAVASAVVCSYVPSVRRRILHTAMPDQGYACTTVWEQWSTGPRMESVGGYPQTTVGSRIMSPDQVLIGGLWFVRLGNIPRTVWIRSEANVMLATRSTVPVSTVTYFRTVNHPNWGEITQMPAKQQGPRLSFDRVRHSDPRTDTLMRGVIQRGLAEPMGTSQCIDDHGRPKYCKDRKWWRSA